MAEDFVIEMLHITKEFPGIKANDDITLQLRKGEVHALLGENGAGKSTLMSVLFGLYQPEAGQIRKNGKEVAIRNPNDANALGIGMVHQHFKLVECFSVLDNIILGVEPNKMGFLQKAEARKKVMALSEKYGLRVDPDALISDISVGMQQRVEILKMLYRDNEILIFDEPTAVLTPQEIDELMEIMRGFKKEGKSILFITHKLNEIMAVADRCTVLRKGKCMGTVDIKDTTKEELSRMMVGRHVQLQVEKKPANPGKAVLDVKNVTMHNSQNKKDSVKNVSFQVHGGEIVCLAGIEGNGQTELAECVAGMRPVMGGSVTLCGRDVTGQTPGRIREAGLSYIPEDRISTGMDVKASVAENLIVGKQRTPAFSRLGIHLRRGQVKKYAQELTRTFDIRTSGVDEPAGSLSGGNMQKVVLAREFSFGSPVLLVCQPTRGVDIGATEFIHERIVEKRDQGCAVLLISADLDELMRLSDRLVTVFEGKVTGRFRTADVTREEIGYYMTGGRQDTKEAEAR